ncbi:hypothetical protein [Candidatus Chlamydia sanziniae]|uniref:Uncharacterized protein n=1 Tax=Candidatus Chlamydia sanziniae TaxID=1806891 RepID=A0A1A9HTM3_9CHLA|nr:hypothetical protein [Candidatus Chlamydia sanziniae]ANH78348.1 hypothetical protein Cs308_0177 [Candidatus Chlamydia sanziniae]
MLRLIFKFSLCSAFLTSFVSLKAMDNFVWQSPKRLTLLGNPFIDVILHVNPDFMQQCQIEVGTVCHRDKVEVQKVFLLYKKTFPNAPILIQRKEPLNLSQDLLNSLGILCIRNEEIHNIDGILIESGPALKKMDFLRLILHCPDSPESLLYSVQETGPHSTRLLIPSLVPQGYALIDGELLLFSDSIENFLHEAKKKKNHIMLDLNDPHIVSTFLNRLWPLLNDIYVLFLSEESAKALTAIPDLAKASRLLSHTVPILFIYSEHAIRILQEGKEIFSTCNQDLTERITGFLFGYINHGSLDYCLHCADSLSGEISLKD